MIALAVSVAACSDDDATESTTTSTTSAGATIPDGSFNAEPKVSAPDDANAADGLECRANGSFSGAVSATVEDMYAPAFRGEDDSEVWSVDVPEIGITVTRSGSDIRAQGRTSNSAWFGSGDTVTIDGDWGAGASASVTGSIVDANGANPVELDLTFDC